MNRRGKVFTLGLLLIYVGATVLALILVNSTFRDLPRHGIGTYQAGVLSAYDRSFQKLSYIEAAAKLSIADSAEELYNNTQSFFTFFEGDATKTSDCNAYGYQLWDCDIAAQLKGTFSQKILEHLNKHLSVYPEGGFGVDYTLSLHGTSTDFTAGDIEEPILPNLVYGITPAAVTQALSEPQGYLSWPSTGSQWITSCFGDRPNTRGAAGKIHQGMDIGAGGEAIAAADGVVMNDIQATDYGTLWIKHSDTLSFTYLHLDKRTVTLKKDDVVQRGQVIGIPSNTGCAASRCPKHLHFEVLTKGTSGKHYLRSYAPGWQAVNPICFFDGLTDDRIVKTATDSCFREGYPVPATKAYCAGYDLKLEEASTYHDGTLIGREENGTPILTEEPATGEDALRPDRNEMPKDLTMDQVAKFDTTMLNRQKLGWNTHVIAASADYGIDQALILGIITQESLGEPDAISGTGCLGLMQLCYTTALGAPQYNEGDMTKCGSNCQKLGNCKCTHENDKRFDQEKNIMAGTYTIKQKLSQFNGYTDKLKFGIASYNVGEGIVKNAIRGTNKDDPSWEEVIAHLEKNPELISYGDNKPAKVKEVKGYVPAVLAYAAAWKGAPLAPQVLTGNFGDVKQVGTYRYDPSVTVDHPDYLTPFTNLITETERIIDFCSKDKDPGRCLGEEAAAKNWERCENESAAYFLLLYESLRDCAENQQYGCQCALPVPGAGVGTLSINAAERNALLSGVTHLQLENISEKTIRVEGVVPKVLELTLNGSVALAYEEAVPEGMVVDRIEWDAGWVVEKDTLGHLVFREEASDVAQCAFVKTKFTYCASLLEGLPPMKFAVKIIDTQPPTPPLGLAFDGVNVVFSPSFSEDVSFYNVYDAAPGTGAAPVLQTREQSFEATTYLDKTLYVTAVDKAGNEGADASVRIH